MALTKIKGVVIDDETITTDNILDGTIDNADIKNSSIDVTSKLTGSVPTANLSNATAAVGNATASDKGISSFSSDNFAVSSGAVTIKDLGVATAEIQANAVTGAKFNADVISGQTELAAEPADTDEFLVSDAGVLKRIDYSLIKGGGAMTLLNTTTISSSTNLIDFNSSLITSTYKVYEFHLIDMITNGDGETGFGVRFSANNGSSVPSSGYRHLTRRFNEGGTSDISIQGSTDDQIKVTNMNGVFHGMATGEGISMVVRVYNPTGSGQTRLTFDGISIADRNTGHSDESMTIWSGGGMESAPSAVNFIRFTYQIASFTSGVVKLYGIV